MFKIKKNEIEGFKVEEYLKVFPETATQYLDWKVQQLWFYTVYPEGAIITEEPQPDPFKTPDTWVATTKVYLTRADRMDNLPAVQRSAKRGPKDNAETEDTLDTYTLSIIASIASALTALGFGPALLTNAEKDKLSSELLGTPLPTENTVSVQTPVANTTVNMVPAPAAPTVSTNPEVQPAPRRGRPTKAEQAAKEAQKAAEQSTTPEPTPVPATPETVATERPTVVETPASNATSINSIEEARETICGWHNLKGKKIGDIWDARTTDNLCKSYIEWSLSSDRAPYKHPVDYAAICYLNKNSN